MGRLNYKWKLIFSVTSQVHLAFGFVLQSKEDVSINSENLVNQPQPLQI